MTILASDDFNRANSSTLGASWTSKRNNLQVISNACGGSDDISYHNTTMPNDHWAQATFILAAATGRVFGVGVRLQAGVSREGVYGGCAQGDTGDAHYTIWKYVGANYTALATASSATVASNDVAKLEASGTSYTLYANAASVASVSDASYSSGSAGLVVATYSEGTITPIDNFSAGDFGVPNPAMFARVVRRRSN